MKINLDIGKILVAVLGSAIIGSAVFAFGEIIEFQEVKRQVGNHESQLVVVSQIVCKYAIRDKLQDADTICSSVLGGRK